MRIQEESKKESTRLSNIDEIDTDFHQEPCCIDLQMHKEDAQYRLVIQTKLFFLRY